MTINQQSGFTSADAFPAKLLLNDGVRLLEPVHVQWLPTNQCNMNCRFCACSERRRDLEMDLAQGIKVIRELSEWGCIAVTITGGGEPLCYPGLDEMIDEFHSLDIEVGLVTNGLFLGRLDRKSLAKVTWCRISHSDERHSTPSYWDMLRTIARENQSVDWAFSYVVGEEPRLDEIRKVVTLANECEFTHVRIVADILNANRIDLDPVRESLQGIDGRVIYQPRNAPVASSSCVLGYVKPVIGPDFKMYHCCGVQYALEKPSRDLPQELCMGDARDLSAIYGVEEAAFSVDCVRCYYESYNAALCPLIDPPKHARFV